MLHSLTSPTLEGGGGWRRRRRRRRRRRTSDVSISTTRHDANAVLSFSMEKMGYDDCCSQKVASPLISRLFLGTIASRCFASLLSSSLLRKHFGKDYLGRRAVVFRILHDLLENNGIGCEDDPFARVHPRNLSLASNSKCVSTKTDANEKASPL